MNEETEMINQFLYSTSNSMKRIKIHRQLRQLEKSFKRLFCENDREVLYVICYKRCIRVLNELRRHLAIGQFTHVYYFFYASVCRQYELISNEMFDRFGRIYKMTHRSHNMFDAINLNKLSITIPQISKCVEKNPPKSNSVVNDCEMEEKRSRIRELIDENETLQREFHLEKRDKKFLMKLEKNLFELMKEKHESLSEELGSLKSDWKNLILIDGISALQRRRLEMLLKR